jgi:DNA-binding transcriptional regulator LsrR (DeoR family)
MRPAGPKTIHIKMEDLARMIAESRLNLSRELNKMHDEGIIRITRGEIYIPALEKLIGNK